jgi:ribosomal protein S18 acetylase RimI-like enzyme
MVKMSDLYNFLKDIDEDFSPCLSSKVDLEEFVEKIQNYAELIVDETVILRGLVVLYCNDFSNYKAYISLVGIRREFRGMGIARRLMIEAIQKAKDNGMKIIGIHSNNVIALNLYKSLGFVTKEFGEREYLELKL